MQLPSMEKSHRSGFLHKQLDITVAGHEVARRATETPFNLVFEARR